MRRDCSIVRLDCRFHFLNVNFVFDEVLPLVRFHIGEGDKQNIRVQVMCFGISSDILRCPVSGSSFRLPWQIYYEVYSTVDIDSAT